MSLELAIAENTRAINALIEILRNQAANPAPPVEGLTLEQTFEEPAPKTKKTKKSDPAPEPEALPAKTSTYADAAALVTRLVKEKGRDAAKALLAGFDAANLKEVPEARYAEVIAAVEAVLA